MYLTKIPYSWLCEGLKGYTQFPLITSSRWLHNKDQKMLIYKKSLSSLVTNTALFTLATWLTVPPNVPSNETFFSYKNHPNMLYSALTRVKSTTLSFHKFNHQSWNQNFWWINPKRVENIKFVNFINFLLIFKNS